MNQEYKISQKAMTELKSNWKLISVDGKIYGLAHKSDIGGLTREYVLNTKNYTEYFGNHIGYTIKISEDKLEKEFAICEYGAKNPEKVHIGFTSGMIPDDGIVLDVPDSRIVLVTASEAQAFVKEAKKHDVFLPDNSYIDSSSPEMRAVIPEGKIKVPNSSGTAEDFGEFLQKNGVPIVSFDE